jgi:hypothetical protein
MRIERDNQPAIVFSEEHKMRSREAVEMFKKDRRIYKLLKFSEALHDAQKKATDVVPSPVIRVYQAKYLYKDQNGLLRNPVVLVIEMREVSTDNFFQMSNGGEARLKNWITEETDEDRMKKIQRALAGAKATGLTDPQGVYLKTGYDPLLFFDLHPSDRQNAVLDGIISIANAKLEELSGPSKNSRAERTRAAVEKMKTISQNLEKSTPAKPAAVRILRHDPVASSQQSRGVRDR